SPGPTAGTGPSAMRSTSGLPPLPWSTNRIVVGRPMACLLEALVGMRFAGRPLAYRLRSIVDWAPDHRPATSMPTSTHHDLVADIGGTNARFARVEPDGRHGEPVKLAVADYPDLAAATR